MISQHDTMQACSLTVNQDYVYVGWSHLEGNIWDGSVKKYCCDTFLEESNYNTKSGVSCLRKTNHGSSTILLVAMDDGSIDLLNVDDLQQKYSISYAHENMVSSIVAIPDSTNFYSAGHDGAINQWDINHISDSPLITIADCDGDMLTDIATNICDSSNLVVSVDYNGLLRLWDNRSNSRHDCCLSMKMEQIGLSVTIDSNQSNSCYVGLADGYLLQYDFRMLNNNTADNSCSCLQNINTNVHKLGVRRVISHKDRPREIMTCSDDMTIAVWSCSVSEINLISR